jgi:fructose-1,6-bisphosphatase
MAVDDSMPILDKLPSDIHERSVFITGSRVEVARYLELQGTVKG